MAWTQGFPSAAMVEERTERALRWPIGAVSPLWAVFGAAASAGVAWWWMSRWTRAVNVEALADFAAGPAKQAIGIVADAELRVEEAVVVAGAAAAEAPPPIAEPQEPPAADDLTRLSGIGPKLSAALTERGVTRFAQIADWTADDLAEVDAALSLKGRAVREAWVAQARRFANGAAED